MPGLRQAAQRDGLVEAQCTGVVRQWGSGASKLDRESCRLPDVCSKGQRKEMIPH